MRKNAALGNSTSQNGANPIFHPTRQRGGFMISDDLSDSLNDTMPPIEERLVTFAFIHDDLKEFLRNFPIDKSEESKTHFVMRIPDTCCVCNNLRESEAGRISLSASYDEYSLNFRYVKRHTFSINFPLCKRCTSVQWICTRPTNLEVSALLIGLGAGVILTVISFTLGLQNISWGLGMLTWFVVWPIAALIIESKKKKKISPRAWKMYERIKDAVQISKINYKEVTLIFKNASYADLLKTMNPNGISNLGSGFLTTFPK
jgi:hypothetical protein